MTAKKTTKQTPKRTATIDDAEVERIRKLMGASEAEIVDIMSSPAGIVITHADGTSYIEVPADSPDAEGKTGLMFLAPPEDYKGIFPVFASDLSGGSGAVADDAEAEES